jgi:mono/diheme cytochrome c family protein
MAGALNRRDPRGEAPATTDRAAKALLLISSLVTLGLLVGAMVRENVLTPWRFHQRAYRTMLQGSADERQRRLADDVTVEVRQVDLPAFRTVDRCVSCHLGIDNPAMATAPQPHRTHPGDYLKDHPVAKYGCTVCHRGQGAATSFREAKATDVHWDYPLLPARLTQASCGACHAAGGPVVVKHAPLLARGHELFLDRGCLACHKLDGVGGQLGPALDGIGRKIKQQLPMTHIKGEHTLVGWLQEHFASPQAVVPGSKMRPPRLTPAESDALTAYMLSLQAFDLPQTFLPADRIVARAAEITNTESDPVVLYRRLCTNCHGDGTHGVWDPFFHRFAPAVRGPGLRGVADTTYLRTAIEKGRPGTGMPAWGKSSGGLSRAQVDRLVEYLVAGDNRPAAPSRPLPDVVGGDVGRGGQLFTRLCSGCHGENRLAPTLSNPVFQATASDEFLARTIRQGRPDTAMPAWQRDGAAGLTDGEVRDLVAHVRSLGRPRAAAAPVTTTTTAR